MDSDLRISVVQVAKKKRFVVSLPAMKSVKNLCSFVLIFLTSHFANAQYIDVTENLTPTELVQNILIGNSCANVSNVVVSNSYDFGNGSSYGYFSANGSGFPFNEGIVLTTGKATSAIGPNGGIISEGPTSWGGDSDLEEALDVNNSTNATVLEFDFLPLGNKISFDYIFSSEQYLTNPSQNQCNFTDGFVFLLKRANTVESYQNLAVIPNTNIPVRVNTVRGQGTLCPSANEQYFDAFNGFDHPTNYNGQIIALTAQADVIPNELYHIKLVVADQGNNLYDSAIFLGGGSFKIEKNLGTDRLLSNGTPLCDGDSFTVNATDPAGTAYQWFLNDVILAGETNPTYLITSPGTYSVEITLNASTCVSTGTLIVEGSPLPVVTSPATLVQCDENNDGVALYNLNKLNTILSGNNTNIGNVSYFTSQADAENNSNEIVNPESFQNTTTNQLFARVENIYGCASYVTVNLEISSNSVANQPLLEICDDDNDGFYSFSLSNATSQVLNTLPTGLTVAYFVNSTDAFSETNPLPNSFTNTTPNQQTIYARIVNGPDCYDVVPVILKVNTISLAGLESENITLCDTATAVLVAPSGYSTYVWNTSPPQNTHSITVNNGGTYTVTVSNSDGCTATKTFTVSLSEAPQFISVDTTDFSGFNNSVLINFSGSGSYQFSLDNSYYQDSPLFTNLQPGQYSVYIRDPNQCGDVGPIPIYVLDAPKFFSPNDDGVNDIYRIPYLERQPLSMIRIFDRFGKFLYQFNGNSAGWDGSFNNSNLPASDYWYVINLEDGRIVKGHFALIR